MIKPAKPFFNRFQIGLITLVLTVVFASTASASFFRFEMLDARSLALGGAMRSIPDATSGARINPAAIAPMRGVFAATDYATRSKDRIDAMQLTVVDNISSPLAGALQYFRFATDPDEREDISLSIAGGSESIFWGGTGRYVSGREVTTDWESTFVADAGILLIRPNGLNIAVVGHDLFATTLDFLDQRVALGLSYSLGGVWTLSGDLVRHLEEEFSNGQDAHIGLEWAPEGSPWALRAGQMWDGVGGKDAFSAGIGYNYGNVKLGYAIQKIRQTSGMYTHAFTLGGGF